MTEHLCLTCKYGHCITNRIELQALEDDGEPNLQQFVDNALEVTEEPSVIERLVTFCYFELPDKIGDDPAAHIGEVIKCNRYVKNEN